MSNHGHESRVAIIPSCDFCREAGVVSKATHDGRTGWGWAFMCEEHFATHGPGRTGLGIAQRLIEAGDVPEIDPDCAAHPSSYPTFV